MTINEKQDQIIEDFSISDDWFDRYAMLIDMGQELKALPEDKKTPENLIDGCQSRVWITARMEGGNLIFEGDSDALIVKGILSLLISILSGHAPEEPPGGGHEEHPPLRRQRQGLPGGGREGLVRPEQGAVQITEEYVPFQGRAS